MKHNTIPKRAVSCIVALALVFSCILTTFAGEVLSFTGDASDNKCKVQVDSGGGGIVKYEVGSTKKSTKSMYMNNALAVGTNCRFEAEDTATKVFMYWQDMFSKRVYSYDRVITFTAVSRTHLKAIFATVSESKHFVQYVNYGGTLMLNEASYDVGASIAEPTDTKLPGFTFTGWSKSASDVAADENDQVIYPIYTVNDESYTVTLTDDTYASGGGTYSNFQTVNLKAEPKNGAGEIFSYWMDADGTIVSYERNYSFRINYDVTLTAVYGEPVMPEPVIRISKINRDETDMKLTFYAERSVPETYTVVSHGILMSTDQGVADSGMTIDKAGESETSAVRKVCGKSNELCGTFSLAKAKVSYVTEVKARPFVLCKDAAGEFVLVYGDVVHATNHVEE